MKNIFDQVSLISVSCIGMQLESWKESIVQDKYAKAFGSEELIDNLDQVTMMQDGSRPGHNVRKSRDLGADLDKIQ